MTPGVIAAHQAADRERNAEWMMHDLHGQQIGWVRDLYVRAFLAGARHTQQQITDLMPYVRHTKQCQIERHTYVLRPCTCGLDQLLTKHSEDARVEPLINSPTPATGSTASPDNTESEPRGKS